MLVYNNGDFARDPADKPMLGWVVAAMLQAVSRGTYMALLVYKEGLSLIMLGQVLGRKMINVCHAANEANKKDASIDKGFGFGDRVY